MRQDQYRHLAIEGQVRPGSKSPTVARVRLDDGDPTREAAFRLCQDALDAWSALPDDADQKVTAAARDALRGALGTLGAITGRTPRISPYVGRRPVVDPSAGVAALFR